MNGAISISNDLPPERIGLLAGSGRFPVAFAHGARKRGASVHAVGSEGMVDPSLAELCEDFTVMPLLKVGKAIRWFKRHDVKHVVMAGKVEKRLFFQPFRWFKMMPDWRAIHMFWAYTKTDKKDDTMLLAAVQEFGRDNIVFGSALDYCPELLVKHGFLTRRKPNPSQWKDISFGWEIAKEMGRLDIGQSVSVVDAAVLAVEAIEGTDEAIRRAGELCRRGGFTVVKVAKPQQDMRFDVPTVGMQTIHTMHQSGAKVLAIESDMTILLDDDEVMRLADKFGIAIVALNVQDISLRLSA